MKRWSMRSDVSRSICSDEPDVANTNLQSIPSVFVETRSSAAKLAFFGLPISGLNVQENGALVHRALEGLYNRFFAGGIVGAADFFLYTFQSICFCCQ